MKKEYETPNTEVVEFTKEDIVTKSPGNNTPFVPE